MPEIISPIDGRPAGHFSYLGHAAAGEAIEAARRAQAQWRRTELSDRIQVCRGFLDAYAENLDENAELITRMMGKPLAHARGEFEGGTRERVLALCEMAPNALADRRLPRTANLERFIRREPLGVVLDIAAWNYPLLVAINAIVPSVLAGNAVLIKHAPQTALVADQLAQAFEKAGSPPGLVQAFIPDHPTIAKLLAEARFDHVCFTGSVKGGRAVHQAATANALIGVGLELGGKDPALVLEDCDFDFAVENIADAAFYNAGQSCCAVERVYVKRAIFDRFVEAFVSEVHKLRLGNPLDPETNLGPVVNAAAASRIQGQVDQALAQGATKVSDDSRFDVPDLSNCYLPPRVLTGVDASMDLMREETFGPAIGIMPVDDDASAIAQMNDSDYGLTASIWTSDESRALAIAEQVEAGTVYQNRADYLDPRLAWTGVKNSGLGCSLSDFGFDQVTRPKSFHFRFDPHAK